MKIGMTGAVSLVGAAMAFVACAAGQKEPQGPNAAADAGAIVTPQAADAAPSAPPPPAHPFAKTAGEATGLIDEAVTSRAAPVTKCVDDARARRKDPHAKVMVEIGIDQEGSLLGVKTPKGQPEDKTLNECVQTALTGAPFPRSHAGVITIKKTFEDTAVYK